MSAISSGLSLTTFQESFNEHPGQSNISFAFNCLYPFREQLLSMLRPIDIISLVMAISGRLSRAEKRRYMVWWRQIWFDMKWAGSLEDNNCSATIIGNDLRRLNAAIRYGDFRLNLAEIRFVVVIGEGDSGGRISIERNAMVKKSFDVKVVWHHFIDRNPPINTLQTTNCPRTCLISITHDTFADLYCPLSKVLSRHKGPLNHLLTGPGRRYPGTCALWDTEWQQLGRQMAAAYKPTRMHYIVDEVQLHKYWMRLFVNSSGVCSADFLRRDEVVLEQ